MREYDAIISKEKTRAKEKQQQKREDPLSSVSDETLGEKKHKIKRYAASSNLVVVAIHQAHEAWA